MVVAVCMLVLMVLLLLCGWLAIRVAVTMSAWRAVPRPTTAEVHIAGLRRLGSAVSTD
jgi:hypothetical protein